MPPALRPVVILSSIDWDAAWQRHQIFAAQFARRGHPVYFVENTGLRAPKLRDAGRLGTRALALFTRRGGARVNPVPPGVTLIAPLVLPPTGAVCRRLNSQIFIPRLLARLRALAPKPLVVAYMPSATTLELARGLDAAAVVYDCASNFRAHPDAPADLPETEKALLTLASLVVCDSDTLFAQKKAEHKRVVQIHQGVAEEFFAAKPAQGTKRLAAYGTWLADSDPTFLTALAGAGFSVTISGFIKAPAPSHPGIKVLQPAARDQLVARLEAFDGFLLPYRLNEFMRGVVPAKIYECLAMGRPVIATPLPSLLPFAQQGLIYVAETPEDWLRVAKELPKSENPLLRQRRVDLAREHTHEREFARLLEALGGVVDAGQK